MRICHIVGTHGAWGGLERAVVDLAEMQVTHGHKVTVLAAPVVLDRVASSVVKIALPFHHSRRDPRLLWALFRQLKELRPEILHAHANKAAATLNAIRPFIPRVPTVATVQNTKRSVGMFRPFDSVIAVSRRAGDQLGDISHKVIWNAIPKPTSSADLQDSNEVLPFIGQGKPVICAIGRLVEAKGFDLLLEAAREVDAYFWIVGSGVLEQELKTQAERLGVSDRVWFAGFRKDAEGLMERADFMVISSRREGFPFAFVEMLHRRKIVVGTRVAGVEDVLEPPYLVEVEDPHALAQAMQSAAENLSQATDDFAKYWSIADESLDLAKTSLQIETIYAELLSRSFGRD